jgi:hypothetical protein
VDEVGNADGFGGASEGIKVKSTPPPAPTLAGTLTSALSTAAKRTAEEILALRRTEGPT